MTTLVTPPSTELEVSFAAVRLGAASAPVSRLGLKLSASTGSAASLSAGAVATSASGELDVTAGGAPLAQLRDVGGRLYLRLELRNLPRLHLTLSPHDASVLARLGRRLGEGWYVLPEGTETRARERARAEYGPLVSFERELDAGLASSTAVSEQVVSGLPVLEVRGSLDRALALLEPDLVGDLGLVVPGLKALPSSLSGSYAATLRTAPGGRLRAMRLELVVGAASGQVQVAVSHHPLALGAPAGAAPLPLLAFTGLLAGA